MCRKAEIAEKVSVAGYNVTETLCVGKDPDGNAVECEFKGSCPYFRQLSERREGPGLLIGAHAYLPIRMEMLAEKRLDLVVIDETWWQSMVRHTSSPIDRFTAKRQPGWNSRQYGPRKGESAQANQHRFLDDADEFDRVQLKATTAIRAAYDARRNVTLADFRAAGLTTGDCGFAAGVEYSRLGRAELHPGQDHATQHEAVQRAVDREAFTLARTWRCIGAELATQRTGPLMSLRFEYDRLNRKTGTLENLLRLDYSVEGLFQTVPLLMIDADADPMLIERFYPNATFNQVAARWTGTRVRQVTDRTGSKLAFKEKSNRDRVRGIALDLVDQLAPHIEAIRRRNRLKERSATLDPRPLVVCQMQVEDAWKEEGHAIEYDGGPRVPDAPFRVAHFGNVRGKDDWRHTTAAIIVGRNEPSAPELERVTRALFYKSEEEVPEIEANDRGRIVLPKRAVTMTAKDGSKATVQVSYHPDERADRVLRQIREAEISQAIARVRPVHRTEDDPCEVLILTNVPGRIQPDTFATWAQLVPDRFRTMELAGFVPDLAPDCADAYPTLFDSPAAVRQAASRRNAAAKCDASYESSFYRGCHTFEGSIRVEYRREGNRRGRQGTVALRPGDTPETVAQRVREALPDAYAVVLLGALPDPLEAAQVALDAAIELDAYIEEVEAEGGVIWWRVPAATVSLHGERNVVRPVARPLLDPDPGRVSAF
ncbi:hypothetical protein [Aureimonas phyllosphaerae]|uniref:Uncharacterized protein n=1 Tax=Aureimonas phyllosphaerae TaxID=1166078 RepID=A0A7W6BU91_9HYPH|nr:hypothetical protein [Aureimonas phyllosphaerae]MBB3938106.1 hypothetical protein [Aureimonas phyllosphaerae]MBB3962113.1 hypothetical protein [Aureimonas phyllosphaerae]